MLPAPFQNALVLTGPTGSGKTRLGIDLAERLGAEIISMDSMAVYRGMDIGTAKPTADLRRVSHHLLDVLEPWESASVAWWLERARACCREIEGRGRRVLFVGGTPLYLKALLCGLFDGPPADLAVRSRLEREAEEGGHERLHARLAGVDPATAARLHPNDRRRIVRALEVWELTGRPISDWQQQWAVPASPLSPVLRGEGSGVRGEQQINAQPPHPQPLSPEAGERGETHLPLVHRCIYLDVPRAVLYERINRRVERMVASGLVEEVQALRQLDRPLSRAAAQALGYKELFDFLDGKIALEEAVVRIQTRSRNFAKRQLTWFRHLPGCRPATEELTFSLWGLTM
jgi:tRNA dimethylallyltransferase